MILSESCLYLDDKSKYDYLANLPEGEDISEAVNTAMRLVEEENNDLKVYYQKTIKSLIVIC